MSRWAIGRRLFCGLLALLAGSGMAVAEETRLTVRASSRDAKLIGTSMGGVRVTVTEVETGRLLAAGVTSGTTGDTARLVTEPRRRRVPVATEGAARFDAVIDVAEPILVEIRAFGPLGQRQSAVSAAATLWLLPGKHLDGGDGVVLELVGFAVDVLAPAAHSRLPLAEVAIEANLVLLCGCPVTPGGTWDSEQYEIEAVVLRDGAEVARLPLAYDGAPSRFSARFRPDAPGVYEIQVWAYDALTGNTGIDRTTFLVAE